MRTDSIKAPPPWLRAAAWLAAGAILILVLGGALALSRGAADPPTAGPIIWSDAAPAWALSSVPQGEGRWLPAPADRALPTGPFTLSVRAALGRADGADGADGAAWGVWLETQDGGRVLYAVSDEGYITTRRCPSDSFPPFAVEECPALQPDLEWNFYPRAQLGAAPNTITLHQEASGAVRLWLNRERLSAAPVARSSAWGVWLRSGRAHAAQAAWQRAELRARANTAR